MPRNAAGNYSLPLPPVVTGTTIVASFENTTDTDIATELTNSLDRNGRGGMLAPFKIADGTVSAPGIAFTLDPDNGFYRIGADDWAATVGGVKVMGFTANAVTFTKNVSAPIFFADPGSAAAPAYAIRDANTGIYSASAGVINITLAGTTKYWFDASIHSFHTLTTQ